MNGGFWRRICVSWRETERCESRIDPFAILAGMPVVAADDAKVGVVSGQEGPAIRLTFRDSPDRAIHYIPLGWVESVDREVHLSTTAEQTTRGWKPLASHCWSDN